MNEPTKNAHPLLTTWALWPCRVPRSAAPNRATLCRPQYQLTTLLSHIGQTYRNAADVQVAACRLISALAGEPRACTARATHGHLLRLQPLTAGPRLATPLARRVHPIAGAAAGPAARGPPGGDGGPSDGDQRARGGRHGPGDAQHASYGWRKPTGPGWHWRWLLTTVSAHQVAGAGAADAARMLLSINAHIALCTTVSTFCGREEAAVGASLVALANLAKAGRAAPAHGTEAASRRESA